MQQALSENDFERALSIAEKIRDVGLRSNFDSLTRYLAALAAIGKEDVDRAYRYAKDLPSLQQRAIVFDKLVRALQNKKDFGRAAETVNQAERSIGKADDGPDKARAMLIIADATSRLDPFRGFEVMKSTVEAINHAENRGGANRAVKQTRFDVSTLNFDQGFPMLARFDFERTLLLAQGLEKKEASALVQLALCRGVLVKTRETQQEVKRKTKTP